VAAADRLALFRHRNHDRLRQSASCHAVDPDKLPLEHARRTKGPASLFDIAAAVGGAPLRYLLEFFWLKPTIETLHQAVATGDSDIIRTNWDRLPPDVRAVRLGELAMTAADFHHRRRELAAD
jgi:hypothetical protein